MWKLNNVKMFENTFDPCANKKPASKSGFIVVISLAIAITF